MKNMNQKFFIFSFLIVLINSIYVIQSYSMDLFIDVCRNDTQWVLKKLNKKKYTDLNFKDDKSSQTPLIVAIINNNTDIACKLIKHKADLNAQDADGNTALMHAILNNNKTIAFQLINAGADVNIENKEKQTALMTACCKSRTIALKLIDSGADINRKSEENLTALFYALDNGHSKTIFSLIAQGADLSIFNESLGTIFDYAKSCTLNISANDYKNQEKLARIKNLFQEIENLFSSITNQCSLDLLDIAQKSIELFIKNLIKRKRYDDLICFKKLHCNQLKHLSQPLQVMLYFIEKWKQGCLDSNLELLDAILLNDKTNEFDNFLEMQAYKVTKKNNYKDIGKIILNWAQISRRLRRSTLLIPDEVSLIASY